MEKVLSKATTISRKKSFKDSNPLLESPLFLSPPPPVMTSDEPWSSLHSSPSSLSRKSSMLLSPSKLSRLSHSPKSSSNVEDKIIKALLKIYKKLEVDLAKFNAKQNSVLKTNILRTTLLPFLRSESSIETTCSRDSKIYKSLSSISTTILLKWWKALISGLASKPPIVVSGLASKSSNFSVSSIDRNAYLEGISRIMARDEWNHIDKETFRQYQTQLTATLDYAIHKLQTLKIVPISISAFTGKVFAYSFFNLPHVSDALLFLLNVKQSVFELNMENFAENRNLSQGEINKLKDIFPSAIHHLIDFKGITDLPKKQKAFINTIPPPKHPVNGIQDPNGSWVRRWCSSDSDVFNSFFRHYISIQETYIINYYSQGVTAKEMFKIRQEANCSLIFNCPGFGILISHIYQIFAVSISRILQNSTMSKVSSQQSWNQNNNSNQQPMLNGKSSRLSGSVNVHQNDMYYNSIIKILKTLRDINHCDVISSGHLTTFIDSLLISIARTISIHDSTKNGLVLNIFHELANHIIDHNSINWDFWLGCCYVTLLNTDHIQTLLRSLAFLFNVWDTIPEILSRGQAPSNEPHLQGWLKNPNKSFKLNFTEWLISNEVWNKFFIHWNPIIRSYYIRLIVWRVIGVNNLENSISIQTSKRVEKKLLLSFENLEKYVNSEKSYQANQTLNFKPDSPLVNRKFGILPTNLKNDFFMINDATNDITSIARPSELRKTHPYEIFDEAIYSCSSLPSSPANAAIARKEEEVKQFARSNSLVNSIGKLFRILSADDDNSNVQNTDNKLKFSKSNEDLKKLFPPGQTGILLNSKKNSASMTSISTAYSSKSRSSSPSIMSYQSTPTSTTDFSTESSLKSDSEVSSTASDLSDFTFKNDSSCVNPSQPPELFKIPPEIIRPVFKFDIIVDHEMMNRKYAMMQVTNSSSKKFYSVLPNYNKFNHHSPPAFNRSRSFTLKHDIPKRPKIPAITIFINDDSFNKFYISTENIAFSNEEYYDSEFEEAEEFITNFNMHFRKMVQWNNLGKSLNEWNIVIEEFEKYLVSKVEYDEMNHMQNLSCNDSVDSLKEKDYLKKIIPFLPVDSTNEFKLLNAG